MMSKPSETTPVQVDCKWLVVDDQDINPHVELLPPYQQWVHNVPLNYIRLSLWTIWLPPEVILPLRYLS